MQIHLSRTHFFLASIVVVLLFLLINRFQIIAKSEITQGVVVDRQCWGIRNSYCNPVIEFAVASSVVQFEGETDLDLFEGDTTMVLYQTAQPQEAIVWSFAGFWLISILWSCLAVLLINALVFSFIKLNHCLVISLPWFGSKKQDSTQNKANDVQIFSRQKNNKSKPNNRPKL